MELREKLKQTFIFSDFTPDELAVASALFRKKTFKKGVVVFHEGQPGIAFYLISSGRVKIYKLAEGGRELIFGIFGDGAIFGDVPVFDGGPYPATASTMVDTDVFYIGGADFERLIVDYPQISLKIIRVLGKRLRQAHGFVMDMVMKTVPQRLSALLLRLADEYGHTDEDGTTVIDLPLSRQEIAELMGVTRETATRELSKFDRSGTIKLDGKKIYLIDRAKLEVWAKV